MTWDTQARFAADHGLLVHVLCADAAIGEALDVLLSLEGFAAAHSTEVARFFMAIARRPPDAVLLGLRLGDRDGLTVLKQLTRSRPHMPVLVLAERPRLEDAVRAMKEGAADVVTLPVDAERLMRSLCEALRPDGGAALREEAAPFAGAPALAGLTPRECDVLRLVAGGQSNKEAGRSLGISPRTVEAHRARVMEKLGARNAADLVRIVLAG